MKNKWSKFLLTAPVAAMSILPITSCSVNYSNYSYKIKLTKTGETYINIIKEKHLRDRLEPANFPGYFATELLTRDSTFIKTSFNEALINSKQPQVYRDRFIPYDVDWDAHPDYATYTVSPESNDYDYVILLLHGGGYAKNINYIHINGAIKLVDDLNAKIYVALHPVLPQHNVEECYAYMDDLYAKMCASEPNKKIVFLGDSSGAGLALAYSQYLYNKGEARLPYARVLFSPWTEVTMSNSDIYWYVDDDIMLHPYGLCGYGHVWATENCPVNDYRVSPIYGEFEDKIKTIIFCGEKEILWPDTVLLYNKLKKHGCKTEFVVAEGLFHDYEFFVDLPEAQETYSMVKNFLEDKPLR